MQSKLFRGKPEALKVEIDAIIGGGATEVQVTKLTAGHYLIIHN